MPEGDASLAEQWLKRMEREAQEVRMTEASLGYVSVWGAPFLVVAKGSQRDNHHF